MKVVGCDCGKRGAVALMNSGKPVVVVDTVLNSKEELDANWFLHLLLDWEVESDPHALLVMEDCWRPKTLVQFVGKVKAVSEIVGIEYLTVAINTWKTRILGTNTRDKSKSIALCQKLYPSVDLLRPGARTLNADRAEALLLAKYGSELRG